MLNLKNIQSFESLECGFILTLNFMEKINKA